MLGCDKLLGINEHLGLIYLYRLYLFAVSFTLELDLFKYYRQYTYEQVTVA